MDPELLAVGDDVDAGRLLLLEPDQRRVLLGALELGALDVATPPRASRARPAMPASAGCPAIVVSSIASLPAARLSLGPPQSAGIMQPAPTANKS